jgi:hypothetical protein
MICVVEDLRIVNDAVGVRVGLSAQRGPRVTLVAGGRGLS